jgi:signal transduction histidine kinase
VDYSHAGSGADAAAGTVLQGARVAPESPQPAQGQRSALATRFILSYCALLLAFAVPVVVLVEARLSQALRAQSRERGLSIARNLAAMSEPSLVSYNRLALAQDAARARRQQPGVAEVVILDKEGRVAAHSDGTANDGLPLPRDASLDRAAAALGELVEASSVPAADGSARRERGLDVSVPVYLEGSPEKWGTVRVRLTTEDVHRQVRTTRLALVALGLVALGLGALGSFWMARRITGPLSDLVAGTLRAAGGDLEARIDLRTGDEIEELGRNFNRMVEQVQAKQRAIEELNRDLEEKVRGRTEDLSRAKGALEKAYAELTQAELHMIHSEKMASLGQLVAGIAHEINTPSSAIAAAVFNVADDLRVLSGQVQALLATGLTPREARPFFALIERALSPEAGRRAGTAEIRQRSRALEGALVAHGFADARELALTFTRLGLQDELEALAAGTTLGPAATTFLESAGRLALAVNDVRLSIETITRLVKALKGYSHLDQAEMIETDVHDGIETTLTILRSQIRYGVEVERRYGRVPLITANIHELNQVWTNLIHNALQAMNGVGRLTIETWREAEFVGVRITDSGPGIPEAIRGRIFDPFFTTKDQGEGTGLGLGITQQIVQRHQGRIRVDSEPGRTSFEVLLPLSPARMEAGA